MAILSASRRTDIPTFYGEWFINRLREGFFMTRNPYNDKVTKVSFRKEDIDCIVFWTKNPASIINYLPEIREYWHYFQFTVTGYDRDIEANLPDKTKIIQSFKTLSYLGSHVIWRYDPIVFTERYTPEWHIKTFRELAKQLCGHTDRCVISFVDMYTTLDIKAVKNARSPLNAWGFDLNAFCKQLADIAREYGMTVYTCAEAVDLSACGIKRGKCIDDDYIFKISGKVFNLHKDSGQRKECGCVESVEMGAYNTCLNGCKYCYACKDKQSVRTCVKRYDPTSPLLCDSLRKGETYFEKQLKAFGRDPEPEQLTLF